MNRFFTALDVLILALLTNLALAQTAFAQQIGTIGIGDITVSAAQNESLTKQTILAAYENRINSALVDTRKFTVLNHQALEARLANQGLTLDGYYDGEYRKNGIFDQFGLDYIFKLDISKFSLTSAKQGNAKSATVNLEYQMFGVADLTQDFQASISIQVAAETGAESTQQLFDRALEKSVVRLTQHLTTTLFPIRVVKRSEDLEFTLNYGKGYLEVGDSLSVYADDTAIALGSSGEPIGTPIAVLKIISVDQKFALARAINGENVVEKGLPAYLQPTN